MHGQHITTRPLKRRTHQLIERAKQGDTTAFGTIYLHHKNDVFRLCLRLTNSASDSEDLTQDVFLQVFRKLDSFRGDAAFSTWLHRVAMNTTMMFLRSRRRHAAVLLTEDRFGEPLEKEYQYHSSGPSAFTCLALKRAIAELPQGRRNVLILHDVYGMNHAEVADHLGIAAITCKSQLHHARVALRSILGAARASPDVSKLSELPVQADSCPAAA